MRRTLALGGDRRASVLDVTGSMLLSGPSRPARGFRGEAVVLVDNVTGMVGRAVWTDEHGERVFSELRGDTMAGGRRVLGTIVGGTGRYAGATGDFAFEWQYLLEAEDGTVQGRTVELTGRIRVGETPPP